jgi:CheY-like chemotaxis protein
MGTFQGKIQPLRILLVDDDQDFRTLFRESILQGERPCEVFEVSGGNEALDFLFQRKAYVNAPQPDLIYLDIEMNDLSGQEVLKRIKLDLRLKEIPVVMMTGMDNSAQCRQAIRNGANSFNIKPVDPIGLVKAVQSSADYWLWTHRYPNC